MPGSSLVVFDESLPASAVLYDVEVVDGEQAYGGSTSHLDTGGSADWFQMTVTGLGIDASAIPATAYQTGYVELHVRVDGYGCFRGHRIHGGLAARRTGRSQGSTRLVVSGANRLSGVLRMAALSLSRSKTALGAYYRRIARRKEGKVAIFATAR